ncbi:unnamed protein product [Onchocerca ochengi]|uniref:DUF5641 domain-containing protein n=1 Tax=Onchocerca ochengi TaxID=42157 RepID=A0A182EWC0_ONCOC|nr:unnamed protein product [Onchocerca ochengi]
MMGSSIHMFYYESGPSGDGRELISGKFCTCVKKRNDLEKYNSESSLEWSTLRKTDRTNQEGYVKSHRKEAAMGKRTYNARTNTASIREYVNPKNSKDCAPIIEEIVLVDELETPRGLWKLAKVKEFKKGKDGVARTALVEMPNGNTSQGQ